MPNTKHTPGPWTWEPVANGIRHDGLGVVHAPCDDDPLASQVRTLISRIQETA